MVAVGTLLLNFLLFLAVGQSPEGGGIVYGDEIGVGVSAPPGWVFDSTSGTPQGLHGVMYPEGSSWADATEVMYVNLASMGEGQELDGFVREAIARNRERSPNLQVIEAEPIEIEGGGTAVVRHYFGDKWGNWEAVAYAAKGRSVAIYVLSCRTRPGFQGSLDDFRSMVGGSFFTEVKAGEGDTHVEGKAHTDSHGGGTGD
jgi:hypothetical protein